MKRFPSCTVPGALPTLRLAAALTVLAGAIGMTPSASAIGDEIAVAARAFNGYTRTRLPDKSFQPETFTFAEGGRYDAPIAGDPIDDLSFVQIARQLVPPLARQGYVQSAVPADTQLLIFVFWGTTRGTEDSSNSPAYERMQESLSGMNADLASARADMRGGNDAQRAAATDTLRAAEESTSSALTSLMLEQSMRDKLDQRNAGILGFQSELWRAYTTQMSTASQDLLTELRVNRYFVVLKAYDFQAAWKNKQRKILWEARFSIRERGVDFREQLPAMAAFASQYFGKDLHNLLRRPLPEVKIEYGDPTFINYDTPKE